MMSDLDAREALGDRSKTPVDAGDGKEMANDILNFDCKSRIDYRDRSKTPTDANDGKKTADDILNSLLVKSLVT